MKISTYAKAIAFMIAAGLGFLVTALADDQVTVEEGINLGILIAGAFLVYMLPNLPEGWRALTKLYVSAGIAAAVVLVSALTDGVTMSEWMQIGVAFLGGLGVYIVPNEPEAVVDAHGAA